MIYTMAASSALARVGVGALARIAPYTRQHVLITTVVFTVTPPFVAAGFAINYLYAGNALGAVV